MKFTGTQIGIVVSNLATALLHLSLLPSMGPDPIALNGLGYLGLLGAYFIPMPILQENHKMAWWGMFGYTALTFVLWIIMGDKNFVFGEQSAIGYYAKAAEIFLMVFLWADKKS